MRSVFLFCLILLTTLASVSAQNNAPAKQSPSPAPLLSPSLCGPGTFVTSLAGQTIGREDFEIKCLPAGGYSVTFHATMDVAGSKADINSELLLDPSAIPSTVSMKGNMLARNIDQSIVFNDGTAKISTEGRASEMAYQRGASFISSNITVFLLLVAVRYDTLRGGVQEIPIFPSQSVKMEYAGRDEVRVPGATDTKEFVTFDRYSLQVGPARVLVWEDAKGRISIFASPEQKFVSVREEYANLVAPLYATIAATLKQLQPDYGAPPDAAYTSEPVTIKVKTYELAGTLTLPKNVKGPFPVVVTSTGSGQQTRDEPLAIVGLEKYRPFRQLADYLSSRGIAVLRVDDRGVGDSTGMDGLQQATSFDFADDVRAQIAYLRTRADIDPNRIAIVGHSEGGMIAPLVAASDPKLAAIVLLAGPGQRGDEILLYQMNYPSDHDPKLTEAEKAKRREANRRMMQTVVDGGDTTGFPDLLRYPWTRAFVTYDPLPTIRKVHQPILILQGAIDRQITAEQAEMLADAARRAGNKRVTVKVFPGLNHLFLPGVTGEESEYSSPSTTSLGDDLLKLIGDWLQSTLQVKQPATTK